MPVPIKERVLLVGCPRSGTTLLQSLLAAHSDIASFPESHFFRYLIPQPEREPKRSLLGLISNQTRPNIDKFLREIDREEMEQYLPSILIFQKQYTQRFIKILDSIAQQQSKSIWLEKTPGHVRYIDYIEKWVKKAKFIHIVRNGADVVASLYEETKKHPKIWHGAWDIDKCIAQWKEDVQISYRHSQKTNHILVKYESLVDNPSLVIENLCDFMNVTFEDKMLQEYKITAQKVILANEPWKKSVSGAIQSANGKKFDRLFSEEQRDYIFQELSVIKINS